MLAAKRNEVQVMRLLLSTQGTDIGAVDKRGRNALMNACNSEDPLSSSAAAVLLLSWPPDRLNDKDQDGHTAFTLACKAGAPHAINNLVLKAPAHVDTSVVAQGRTGLEWACATGNWHLATMVARHPAVHAQPLGQEPEQVAGRVQDLTSCIAMFLREARVDTSTAQALATVRPKSIQELRLLPGVPHTDGLPDNGEDEDEKGQDDDNVEEEEDDPSRVPWKQFLVHLTALTSNLGLT